MCGVQLTLFQSTYLCLYLLLCVCVVFHGRLPSRAEPARRGTAPQLLALPECAEDNTGRGGKEYPQGPAWRCPAKAASEMAAARGPDRQTQAAVPGRPARAGCLLEGSQLCHVAPVGGTSDTPLNEMKL